MIKLEGVSSQKDTMHGRINEMRYILDSYKDELRDLGGDPDAIIEVPPLPVKSKSLAL